MKRSWRLVLIAVMVVSFLIAFSYPVLYRRADRENRSALDKLAELHKSALEAESGEEAAAGGALEDRENGTASGAESGEASASSGTAEEIEEAPEYHIEDYLLDYVPGMTWRQISLPEYEEYDAPVLVGQKETARNRNVRTEPLPYPLKEKKVLDEALILPELKEIYELNQELVGWLSIEGTEVDYPVVQRPSDSDYYLKHDFFGEENNNGQIILDAKCDPYTPSYHLVISGHHMRSGSMFGKLDVYKDKAFWDTHRYVRFDTLMRRGTYIVFAAFYSADYDEDEAGFRYNADLQYKIDVDQWLEEVYASALYETDVPTAFGDEFITLTTCDHSRRDDGRFVVICRRVRENEVAE